MLTVQEIQAISFEKTVFGGYDPKAVDDFVEQITEDFASMQKENAALKSKMKVLVDKIEEYRSVEEGMRRALVSAQNIAKETVDKAKLEADQLLSHMQAEQETQLRSYQIQIDEEKRCLAETKQASVDFIAKMTAHYEEQLKELVTLSASDILSVPHTTAATPAVADKLPETSMQEELEKTRDLGISSKPTASTREPATQHSLTQPEAREYMIPEDIRKFMEEQQTPDSGMKIKMVEVNLGDSSSSFDAEKDERSQFSFGELKFGSGYSTENDK